MGSCGCNDHVTGHTLPGPAGVTYRLSVYQGCPLCGSPAGVVIERYATAPLFGQHCADWGEDPPVEFKDMGYGCGWSEAFVLVTDSQSVKVIDAASGVGFDEALAAIADIKKGE